MLMLLPFILAGTVAAQDCGTLANDILTAGPHEAAPMFLQLSQCDAGAAKRVAPTIIPNLIGESDGFDAAIAAIGVGAGSHVMSWMETLQRDEQSRAVRAYGKKCQESEPVQGFLVSAAEQMGDAFWTQRWYRALTECRVPSTTTLLVDRVEAGEGDDRGSFFGVVEAYAVNVGAAAIPKLVSLVSAESDLEMQVNLIGAFADASQAGTLSGLDVKSAAMAATAVRGLSTSLPSKAMDKARVTLQVLLDEEGADKLVALRFKDVVQDDGGLLYGIVVFENATCKNDKMAQRYHVAEALDPGQTWPDQLEDKVRTSVELTWNLNLAERCKGTGEVVYHLPEAPFADQEAYQKWVKEVVRLNTNAELKKAVRVDAAPIQL
jgi:hypothetical protein